MTWKLSGPKIINEKFISTSLLTQEKSDASVFTAACCFPDTVDLPGRSHSKIRSAFHNAWPTCSGSQPHRLRQQRTSPVLPVLWLLVPIDRWLHLHDSIPEFLVGSKQPKLQCRVSSRSCSSRSLIPWGSGTKSHSRSPGLSNAQCSNPAFPSNPTLKMRSGRSGICRYSGGQATGSTSV